MVKYDDFMKIITKTYDKLSKVWYRMRLKNDNFTIVTNTCIAGVMYHKLGKQFLSPTINLWMEDKDFFRFVRKIDWYIVQPLKFVRELESTPVAYCGDVLIHFNHYKTEDEAASKWEERKMRINKNNLFIICSDRPTPEKKEEITHEDMLSLKDIPCRGKVIFSTRHYDDIDYIVPLPKDPNGDYVNMYMFDKSKHLQRFRWEEAFDWVHWLNTGEVKL